MRGFVEEAMKGRHRSRTVCGDSGIIYVFIFFNPTEDRERRLAVLSDRIFLARHTVGKGTLAIGIGFVEMEARAIKVCELACLDATVWSTDDDVLAKEIKRERNFDARMTRGSLTESEYPVGPASSTD
jgi:hypothetical protein